MGGSLTKRKIVLFDEERCDGCGLCVPSCAEGAIQIIDGKARLVDDKFCDGLGACLGECPQDAITIVEREAEEFDEKAVEEHLEKNKEGKKENKQSHMHPHAGGCPSARVLSFDDEEARTDAEETKKPTPTALRQWPVQLHLVPPFAPYLQGADLLISADCVSFAYADFHMDLLKGKALVIACPKLDDTSNYVDKLSSIISEAGVKSVTVAIMEVPCCYGLKSMVNEAISRSGKNIPVETAVFSIRGERK